MWSLKKSAWFYHRITDYCCLFLAALPPPCPMLKNMVSSPKQTCAIARARLHRNLSLCDKEPCTELGIRQPRAVMQRVQQNDAM